MSANTTAARSTGARGMPGMIHHHLAFGVEVLMACGPVSSHYARRNPSGSVPPFVSPAAASSGISRIMLASPRENKKSIRPTACPHQRRRPPCRKSHREESQPKGHPKHASSALFQLIRTALSRRGSGRSVARASWLRRGSSPARPAMLTKLNGAIGFCNESRSTVTR